MPLDETPPDEQVASTDRTRLRRHKERGSHDRDLVNAILDEALVCHVGFVTDHGPVVLPMAHVRIGDQLYLHGARANAMLNALATGGSVCVTVTLLDGLVLARSAFHHSLNYRCVTVFGSAERVTDLDEVSEFSSRLVDHLAMGRGAAVRPVSPAEIRRTLVVKLAITEASAKVRTGGPVDEPEDLDYPVWAGHVPMSISRQPAVPESGVTEPLPEYLDQ